MALMKRPNGKRTVEGRILLIQEERFRILGDRGQSYLFTLGRRASPDITQLGDWQKGNVPVQVEYEGEPNLDSGVALGIRPLVR